jgi:hypothetical protein
MGHLGLTTEEMFSKNFKLYRDHVEDQKNTKGTHIEYYLVLQEFEDVFQEILGLPPKRDIDLSIDLVPGDSLVSKNP